MKVNPKKRTEKLLLRQFDENDIENVFKGLSHTDVIKHYGISFDSLEATKEQMTWFADLEKDGTGMWFAVCLRRKSIPWSCANTNFTLSRSFSLTNL